MNMSGLNSDGAMGQFFVGDPIYVEEKNTGIVGGYWVRNVSHTFLADDAIQLDFDLNRMTDGISFSHNVIGAIAAEALRQAGLAHKNRQVDFEKRFLQGEATITGTPGGYFSTTYPFVLVPIPAGTEHTQTNTPHYDVTLCVTAADDIGKVNLEVYDKASNGFKVRNLGSAKSVSFTWTIINTNIQ